MNNEKEEKEGLVEIALYTVGHSNRSAEEFLGLLLDNGVEVLADVRKLPGSNKYPHFNCTLLTRAITTDGLRYSRQTIWAGGVVNVTKY